MNDKEAKKDDKKNDKKNINQEIPEGEMQLDEQDLEKVSGGCADVVQFSRRSI